MFCKSSGLRFVLIDGFVVPVRLLEDLRRRRRERLGT